jgi:hypothetical protein
VSDNPSQGGGRARGPTAESFGFFLAMGIGANAVAMAAFLGFVELILDAPFRSLAAPYAALLVPGLLLPPFLYWARLARARPNSSALRFGIGMFAYAQALTLAFGFSAVWLHILTVEEAVDIFAPLAWLIPAFAFGAGYIAVRQLVKGSQPA